VNRLILKYPYPITAVILLIFAWRSGLIAPHGIQR